MENVVLVVHLILALTLIGVVLLQRSEGGGLGIGGGGGGAMTGRSAATAMGKVTWILAIAFICTSVALTIIAARDSAGGSVVDGGEPAAIEETAPEGLVPGADLLPPSDPGQPLVPDAN
ncbi:preprotein translocase subunit SecG [Octadecabacter sp. R77987]|uniref:preprotein translocase subunit SecG n=1 Tax=Octadecabacter sp. R77987 TaxID=3093874 RepID=UPI00366EED43